MTNDKVKMLLYRSVHRGCKEMDIVLGNFARDQLENLSQEELLEYESITNMDDIEIYKEMSREKPEMPLISKILNYYSKTIET